MELVKKVPWKDWEEWLECWRLLQENPLGALKILQSWAISEPLPVRIECTRLILNTLNELTASAVPSSLLSLKGEVPRLALSMTVTRCTNLLIDIHNDCKFARSISNTAKSIKLPEFIVDLRHDATHSTLPSLFLLSKALQELLNWLFQNYWILQHQYLIEKSEKVLGDIDKFEKRARVTTDPLVLSKFAEGLFTHKVEYYKKQTGMVVARLRTKMKDDPWALLFLKLNSKNPRISASVLQGFLNLCRRNELGLAQLKALVQEIAILDSSVRVSQSNGLKYLLLKMNEEQEAFDVVGIMLDKGMFGNQVKEVVEELRKVCRFGREGERGEVGEVIVKRWRPMVRWASRPIGSATEIEEDVAL